MKKCLKIGLIVSSLVLVISCSCIGVYAYKELNPKKTHAPIIEPTYYSKEEYLAEYKEKVYPIYGGYPGVLSEECAIKEYGIKYDCHFELRNPHCTSPFQYQTLYVYDSALGLDAEPDNNWTYSFKVTLFCLWFGDYPFDTPREYDFKSITNGDEDDEDFFLRDIFYIDYHGRNTAVWYGLEFYTTLDLTEEYCIDFAKKYVTRLDY